MNSQRIELRYIKGYLKEMGGRFRTIKIVLQKQFHKTPPMLY